MNPLLKGHVIILERHPLSGELRWKWLRLVPFGYWTQHHHQGSLPSCYFP
jgi:hypothetical protein